MRRDKELARVWPGGVRAGRVHRAPVADQVTPTGTVELSLRRPAATNDRFAPGASDALLGEMLMATTMGCGGSTVTVELSERLKLRRPRPTMV